MIKAVCIIASDNVVIDGDVVFNKSHLSGLNYSWQAPVGIKNLTIKNTWTVDSWSRRIGFKLSLLWFWHMVILRKSHVYLTGVI